MSHEEKEIWFPAKRYGWGWGFPVAWQGWVVFVIYLVSLLAGTYFAERIAAVFPGAFALYLLVITAVLAVICWSKGEKPGWRWGDRK